MATRPAQVSVAIEEVTGLKERPAWAAMLASQAFWVTVVVALLCLATSYQQPDTFPTKANFFNITRNFAVIGIIAMGMTIVIIAGGIDLSVGSVLALAAVVTARLLEAGQPWWVASLAGIATGAACGAVNGWLIAYVRLPAFVVTLGMLSIARSLAIVASQNRVIYQLGPGGDTFKAIGGGQIAIPWLDGGTLALSNQFTLLVVLAIVTALILRTTAWGRWVVAIGGNENAARLTGIPVDRIKLQTYVIAGALAGLAAIMLAGYQGSASNGMGRTYELYVIAAVVIGGANLSGGQGSVYGAFIGAALIFLIRNSLIMFGVDANWYDLFVGLFIILAVLLERLRGRARG
jgi:ribose transport system permease protein